MSDRIPDDRTDDAPRFEGDRIHDNHQQPGSLTEGSAPARPVGRDEAVVDAEFSGLDNDLVDMGQFGDEADEGLGSDGGTQPDMPRQPDVPDGQQRPLGAGEKRHPSPDGSL